MKCACHTFEHATQPVSVRNLRWKLVELCRRDIECARYTRPCGAGWGYACLPLIEILQDILDLPKSTLCIDFRAETGSA